MKKSLLIFLLVVVMTVGLVGCGEKAPEAPAYNDGTYEGTAEGRNADIVVSVEVKDGKIASVEVTSHEETDGIADPALTDTPAAIVSKNSTDVEAVSSATITSEAIIKAVEDALSKAK